MTTTILARLTRINTSRSKANKRFHPPKRRDTSKRINKKQTFLGINKSNRRKLLSRKWMKCLKKLMKSLKSTESGSQILRANFRSNIKVEIINSLSSPIHQSKADISNLATVSINKKLMKTMITIMLATSTKIHMWLRMIGTVSETS